MATLAVDGQRRWNAGSKVAHHPAIVAQISGLARLGNELSFCLLLAIRQGQVGGRALVRKWTAQLAAGPHPLRRVSTR